MESIFVIPGVIVVVLLVMQFAIWYHANSVARVAASEGARIASVQGQTSDGAAQRTKDYLQELGGKIVRVSTVESSRDDRDVQVVIRGYAATLIPGMEMPIEASSQRPLEKFRSPT